MSPRNAKELYLQPPDAINQNIYDITAANWDYPAGKGPSANCKHVGLMCYALVEFCAFGKLPEYLTCTDKLQRWNKPGHKKVNRIPVAEFSYIKKSYCKKGKQRPLYSEFDPCALSKQANSLYLDQRT